MPDPAKNRAPEKIESIHLMGVGGVAMGALAVALAQAGYVVRGSDRPLYPPMSTFLAARNIPVASGYAAANLEPPPDLVIVGNVIRADNPEAVRLAEMGLPYLSMPQAIGHFYLRGKASIVVAGTHGKTTTTSLVSAALMAAGQDPGFMIGGVMGPDELNFRTGGGRHFVIEGDEYDTAFFDKRPKFVHYRPHTAILTSLEFDHADIYPDLDAVRRAFGMLMERLPQEGLLIAWGDDAEVMAQAARAACRVETYGRSPDCAWRLLEASPDGQGGSRLSLKLPGGDELTMRLPLAGEHNALNGLAALAALVSTGLSPQEAAVALGGFPGVKRRQQVLGRKAGVTLVDDFAHHPTAVAETVAAVARFGLPGWPAGSGRLVAVFEPRSNTSRRNFFQKRYEESFQGADLVFLREPAMTEEIPEHDRFSSSKLAGALGKRGIKAQACPDTDALLAALLKELEPGDCCLVMSNGGFDGLLDRLANQLQ